MNLGFLSLLRIAAGIDPPSKSSGIKEEVPLKISEGIYVIMGVWGFQVLNIQAGCCLVLPKLSLLLAEQPPFLCLSSKGCVLVHNHLGSTLLYSRQFYNPQRLFFNGYSIGNIV